jgi:hypothetical protein
MTSPSARGAAHAPRASPDNASAPGLSPAGGVAGGEHDPIGIELELSQRRAGVAPAIQCDGADLLLPPHLDLMPL